MELVRALYNIKRGEKGSRLINLQTTSGAIHAREYSLYFTPFVLSRLGLRFYHIE